MTRSIPILLIALGIAGCNRDNSDESAAAQQAAADSVARSAQQAARDSVTRAAAADSVARAGVLATIAETMSQGIGFDYGRAIIRPADRPILDRKVELLQTNPSLRIQIAGHTDNRSSERFNQALGLRRAEAARTYLTRAGIAANRIDVISFGETRPFDTAVTRAARTRNRRAEFTVAG